MTSLILQPDEMLSEGQGMRECVRASGGGGLQEGGGGDGWDRGRISLFLSGVRLP